MSLLNIHWKDWCWSWNASILATWCEELTHWKRHRCWERWKAGREGGDRGWHGWHHLLNGHEFEQALGIGDAQGSLACCRPWSCKESHRTERLNRTDESSKYSCHSYIFWMSWSLPLLQGWFPYGGKEVWENVFSPWFIKCDPGIHFPGQIIWTLTKTLQASWNYHYPYEPPTSGRIDRNNTKTGLWQYKN